MVSAISNTTQTQPVAQSTKTPTQKPTQSEPQSARGCVLSLRACAVALRARARPTVKSDNSVSSYLYGG
jgi:hypothetical protein